ncbi:beta-ketoacyl synthase [bacterium SCSIO 12741]|nr:beta-ketoacyl synthase [bacterium SCSIO 12741]
MTLRFENIGIRNWGSLSPLGHTAEQIVEAYRNGESALVRKTFDDQEFWVGSLEDSTEKIVSQIRDENRNYERLDRSVLLALYASRQAASVLTEESRKECGVFIGSSRGATETWEREHERFLTHEQQKTHPLTSPLTTLGNLSYWVAQDLRSQHYNSSLSITCSTSLHALVNACMWLQNGEGKYFLAGGSEAALTPFTMAQMKAIKALQTDTTQEFPCQSMVWDKTQNTMVLGEGAAMALLERNPEPENVLAYVKQIGVARESIDGHTSIDRDGQGLYEAMKAATDGIPLNEIDAVVLHAPGTKAGDLAERTAIERLFGPEIPALTSNKWKIGHTFGASGMLSLEMAVNILSEQYFIQNPLYSCNLTGPINRILVNAIGFGGNAISVLIQRNWEKLHGN